VPPVPLDSAPEYGRSWEPKKGESPGGDSESPSNGRFALCLPFSDCVLRQRGDIPLDPLPKNLDGGSFRAIAPTEEVADLPSPPPFSRVQRSYSAKPGFKRQHSRQDFPLTDKIRLSIIHRMFRRVLPKISSNNECASVRFSWIWWAGPSAL
jgi:hypothetical protein